jgi:hypothetical protein
MHVCKADAAVCDGESGLGRGVSWKPVSFAQFRPTTTHGVPLIRF